MYNKEDFKKELTYVRNPKRIYFTTDFKDGETITFVRFHERPNSWKEGYAYYRNKYNNLNLINLKNTK